MTSAKDLLSKNKTRSSFIPVKRRAWDYNAPESAAGNINTEPSLKEVASKETNTKSAQKTSTKQAQNQHNSITIPSHTPHNIGTKIPQIDHKPNTLTNTNTTISTLKSSSTSGDYHRLSGVQKSLLKAIFTNIISNGQSTSDALDINHLANLARVNINSIKTSIKRLCEKGLLNRVEEKRGRGGWVRFSLEDFIYSEIYADYQKGFPSIKICSPNNNITNTKTNTEDVYSSSNINTITTNLPGEWGNIDIEPLSNIGFSEKQLKQLVTFNTASNVQESINHFSYALDHNKKYKDHANPLNVLMGVLRKGQTWFESAYESPQEKALREMVARKKLQKEKQESLLKELVDLEFPEWEASLSQGERQEILPKELLTSKIQAPVIAFLRQYFIKTVLMKRLEDQGIFSKK